MRDDGIAIWPRHDRVIPARSRPTICARSSPARRMSSSSKSVAVGVGGPLANNVDMALRNLPDAPRLHSAVAGLGGRAITKPSLHRLFRQNQRAAWEARISSISTSGSSAAKSIRRAKATFR